MNQRVSRMRIDHTGAVTDMSSNAEGSEEESYVEAPPRRAKRTQSDQQKKVNHSLKTPTRSVSLDGDDLMQFDEEEDEEEVLVEVPRPTSRRANPKQKGSSKSPRHPASRGAKKASNKDHGKKASSTTKPNRRSPPKKSSTGESTSERAARNVGVSPVRPPQSRFSGKDSESDIERGSAKGGRRSVTISERRRSNDSFEDEEGADTRPSQSSRQASHISPNSLRVSRAAPSNGQMKPLSTRSSSPNRPLSIRPTSVREKRPSAVSNGIRPTSTLGNRALAIRPSSTRGSQRSSSRHNEERSTHQNQGELVPYYPGDDASVGSFDSFHDGDGDGELIEYRGEGEDEGKDDYDAGKLRPPPSMKLKKEDPERGEFPHDKWWQKCLRHFRILSPHPHEEKLKREVRLLIWATLLLDALVAIVSIATFGGTVTECCGRAVMASIPGVDWNLFMNVISYIYLIGIFLEIHPTVREGPIPWNLLNPVFGFLIGFAVFVDDSPGEAIIIWIMELGSVILEIVTYRKLRILHQQKRQSLEKLDDETVAEKGRGYKKTVLLRERREARLVVAASRKKLHYHFVGSTVNSVFVVVTLIMIIFVARGGGLCLVGGEGLDIFNGDQRARCWMCTGEDKCENCTDSNEIDQCYYPYF
jgi:hypothetical protein